MPLYAYKCEKCDHAFDDVRSISERNAPKDEPCPNCGEVGSVEKQLSNARIVSGVNFRAKIPDHFKDRMKDIKKAAGKGCTIDV